MRGSCCYILGLVDDTLPVAHVGERQLVTTLVDNPIPANDVAADMRDSFRLPRLRDAIECGNQRHATVEPLDNALDRTGRDNDAIVRLVGFPTHFLDDFLQVQWTAVVVRPLPRACSAGGGGGGGGAGIGLIRLLATVPSTDT